jgi:hypothetical protein
MDTNRKNIRYLIGKRDCCLKKLRQVNPFLTGSVSIIARECGNKNCKCAKGEKHESLYLTYKDRGKTRTIYIPVDLEEDVKEWVKEYVRIKEWIREVSEVQRKIIRQYVTEKRARKRSRKS